MPRAGDTIGERYRLIAPLAEGGMGTVWRAHHLELQVDVALKLMTSGGNAAEVGKKRFRLEAQAAARLRSPHIVQVLDFGTFEDKLYLAMELLEGEDLETRLQRGGAIPPERCVPIIDGVSKALELAHAGGIIHRDLKPANVFLMAAGDDELVKVLDFGVAKDLRATGQPASTTGGAVVGSPAYMSPEQVWAEPVDRTTDIWSFGVVVFEMVTGKNPFLDVSLAKVFQRIIRDDLPRARDLRPDLPPALDAFFERALARDASLRFPSARAFAEAFREAIGVQLVTTGARLGPVRERVNEHASTVEADGAAQRTALATTASSTLPAQRRTVLLFVVAAALMVLGVIRFAPGRPSLGPASAAPPEVSSPRSAPPAAPSTTTPAAPPSAEVPGAEASAEVTHPPVPAAPQVPRTRASAHPRAPAGKASAAPARTGGSDVDPIFGIPTDAGAPKRPK